MTTQTAAITVQVLCFAQLRYGFAQPVCALHLPPGAMASDVLTALRARDPGLGPLLDVSRLAVNAEYIQGDVALRDGDEVAVIPPVSGG